MKSFMLILTSIFVLTACTVPSPSDFESTEKPLAEDEFIVMWRFSRLPKAWEVLDKSPGYKVDMENAMAPLFQQVIPRIFSDVKNGKLSIREENDVTDLEEETIKDVSSKMQKSYGGTWQNIAPYMEAFHITQRRKGNAKGFPAQELELHLVAQDPEGQLPEKSFGSVRIADLMELDYVIEVDGQTYGLISYLDKVLTYGYPIYLKSQTLDAGLRSLEQAFQMKEILLTGAWTKVEWLAGEPNLSGIKMQTQSADQLNTFTGSYIFASGQGSSLTKSDKPVTVHIEVEDEHLDVEWPTMGPYLGYDIFPSSEKQFFTLYGDRISFSQLEDGRLMMTVIEKNGSKSIGFR